MKKLFLLALLCLGFAAAKAGGPVIANHTPCGIVITPGCYDPTTCTFNPCVSSGIFIPAGSTIPLPVCTCDLPLLQGYYVSWQHCPTTYVSVGDPFAGTLPCPNFPAT